MNSIINIASYQFVPLHGLDDLKVTFQDFCETQGLKGTILLAEEGLNLSLAGTETGVAAIQALLKADARFADMTYKTSYSETQPFKFLRVKLRKEIITMGCPEVQPELGRAPSISPKDFKQWLDEERDITVLDTRNDYEVRFGTFDKATHFHLDDFGQFPTVVDKLEKQKPIVMFCTGGVRCEKAGLHLMQEGFQEVYQLDGGILNYFSEVGGEHYHGECFVFDQRIALAPDLKTHGTLQCQVCQGPVRLADEACTNCIA